MKQYLVTVIEDSDPCLVEEDIDRVLRDSLYYEVHQETDTEFLIESEQPIDIASLKLSIEYLDGVTSCKVKIEEVR